MSLVPTLCGECWRVQLATLQQAQAGSIACNACGAELRVVPGRSFPEAERAAFEELSAIVVEGNVTPMEARSYATQLEHALWSGAYKPLLVQLSMRLPGLLPLEVAAGKNSGAQRGILSRLKAILDALGSARRVSAEYPIVEEPRAPRSGRG